MPDPVEVRAARLGLKTTPKVKAKKKATHVIETQPGLQVTKTKTKKSTKKVKK
jgi:hypothetical protein